MSITVQQYALVKSATYSTSPSCDLNCVEYTVRCHTVRSGKDRTVAAFIVNNASSILHSRSRAGKWQESNTLSFHSENHIHIAYGFVSFYSCIVHLIDESEAHSEQNGLYRFQG